MLIRDVFQSVVQYDGLFGAGAGRGSCLFFELGWDDPVASNYAPSRIVVFHEPGRPVPAAAVAFAP
jgi:hypothetical protein